MLGVGNVPVYPISEATTWIDASMIYTTILTNRHNNWPIKLVIIDTGSQLDEGSNNLFHKHKATIAIKAIMTNLIIVLMLFDG